LKPWTAKNLHLLHISHKVVALFEQREAQQKCGSFVVLLIFLVGATTHTWVRSDDKVLSCVLSLVTTSAQLDFDFPYRFLSLWVEMPRNYIFSFTLHFPFYGKKLETKKLSRKLDQTAVIFA
jgi:hypothetical protein